jgi:hypothetical protein
MRFMTWRALSVSPYLTPREDVPHARRAVARHGGQPCAVGAPRARKHAGGVPLQLWPDRQCSPRHVNSENPRNNVDDDVAGITCQALPGA